MSGFDSVNLTVAVAKRMRAEANNARLMAFDWQRAARLLVARNATEAVAGLAGDWGNTSGDILYKGKVVDASNRANLSPYLTSLWAVPSLSIDGAEPVPCFRHVNDKAEAERDWPEHARRWFESNRK